LGDFRVFSQSNIKLKNHHFIADSFLKHILFLDLIYFFKSFKKRKLIYIVFNGEVKWRIKHCLLYKNII